MTDTKIKPLNQPGDYYFCSQCSEWHIYRADPDTPGHQHITHLDEEQTNSPSAKYYFCGACNKWHTGSKKDHLQNRLQIKRDDSIKPAPSAKNLRVQPKRTGARHSEDAEIGSFDGAAGLWKTESELLGSISSSESRRICEEILELAGSLDKNLHIQRFNRKNGFSFIVKGLKIGEIKIGSGGFVLSLMKNILNKGYTSVRKEKQDFIFNGTSANNPDSLKEIQDHLISESKNLISLRKTNTIGYREKWLHCLLIEQMQDNGLAGLDLDFLYYETPAGKVKRSRQFGREHIDILAGDRKNKSLAVVEVKKEGTDIGSAVSQGLSYIGWLWEHKEHLKPRIKQVGWDVSIDNLKLSIIAPDVDIQNFSLDAISKEQIKKYNCKVNLVSINQDWVQNENISVTRNFEID
ncbi:MAG: hypothetical protein IBX39_02860 [Candidatus Methanoperedenaceae archaeon]|nr:hypothetical protein [Candidatus Methanoperedenaceae archaeon]